MTPPRVATPAPSSTQSQVARSIALRVAYEMKFLVNGDDAAALALWASSRLSPDPHADPALEGAYDTTSTYLDTADLAVYRRIGSYGRCKYRVRRYGVSGLVYLERKSRRRDRVTKRRIPVPAAELEFLSGTSAPIGWGGRWFQERVAIRRLKPACVISYRRTALVGASQEGPLRLTIDRRIEGCLVDHWFPNAGAALLPLAASRAIVEFKFHDAIPLLFKEALVKFRLCPVAVSKYRLCRDAWALTDPGNGVVHA